MQRFPPPDDHIKTLYDNLELSVNRFHNVSVHAATSCLPTQNDGEGLPVHVCACIYVRSRRTKRWRFTRAEQLRKATAGRCMQQTVLLSSHASTEAEHPLSYRTYHSWHLRAVRSLRTCLGLDATHAACFSRSRALELGPSDRMESPGATSGRHSQR